MDPLIVGVLGIIILLILLAFGVHIGVGLGLVGAVGLVLIIGTEASVSTIVTGAFHFATNPEFIVIPTFTLMGLAAMYGGISEATFNALNKLTNKLPGGLGIAAILGCAGFGTVCGSSVVAATVSISSPTLSLMKTTTRQARTGMSSRPRASRWT